MSWTRRPGVLSYVLAGTSCPRRLGQDIESPILLLPLCIIYSYLFSVRLEAKVMPQSLQIGISLVIGLGVLR